MRKANQLETFLSPTGKHTFFAECAATVRATLLSIAAALALLVGCGGGEDAPAPPSGAPVAQGQLCLATARHHDGDTFECATSQGALTVRVAGVDAPEIGQAYALASRDLLRSLTPAGSSVQCYALDSYGRSLCRVFSPGGGHVQAELLREGLAWYSRAYAHELTPQERRDFERLEADAQLARRGLWAATNPMAPWDCRAAKRDGKSCR